jgi:hypothetical protein
MRVWEFGVNDQKRIANLQTNIDILFENLPFPEYSFDFDKPKFTCTPGQVWYVIGNSERDLLGYAHCFEGRNDERIHRASHLSFRRTRNGPYRDTENRTVTKSMIGNYPGYNDYKGERLVYLERMEAFKKGVGIGTALMNHIKEKYGFIEAMSLSTAMRFNEGQGFMHTGIRDPDDMPIMTWRKSRSSF